MALLEQVDLQQAIREAHKDRLAHSPTPCRGLRSRQVSEAFHLAVPLLDVRAQAVPIVDAAGRAREAMLTSNQLCS